MDAEHLYFIGYSLPESDSFFRFLFALGTTGPSRIRSIRVYDPDSSGAVKQRYERMLGPRTQGKLDYQKCKFPDAIADIITSLPRSK